MELVSRLCGVYLIWWMCYCCGHVDTAAVLIQPQLNTESSLHEHQSINVAVETELQTLRDNLSREIRCYCNLPVCVTTGYMCKSALATCFSEIVDPQDLSQTRHGCLELLNNVRPDTCRPSHHEHHKHHHEQQQQQQQPQQQQAMVLCCGDDMCNYVLQAKANDSQGPTQTQIPNGDVLAGGASISASSVGVQPRPQQSPGSFFVSLAPLPPGSNLAAGNLVVGSGPVPSSADLWLKAATIAVPIAGGFILVLLVLLAIQMLKRDRQWPRLDVHDPRHHAAHEFDMQRPCGHGTNTACVSYSTATARSLPRLWGKSKTQCNRAFVKSTSQRTIYPVKSRERQPMLVVDQEKTQDVPSMNHVIYEMPAVHHHHHQLHHPSRHHPPSQNNEKRNHDVL